MPYLIIAILFIAAALFILYLLAKLAAIVLPIVLLLGIAVGAFKGIKLYYSTLIHVYGARNGKLIGGVLTVIVCCVFGYIAWKFGPENPIQTAAEMMHIS